MNELFVALGIMVLALLALLLWFVPHLLQQQATRVAGETAQLREMLLDLLNEQEAVTLRQTQLGSSLAQLQNRIEALVRSEPAASSTTHAIDASPVIHQVEARLSELQAQLQTWTDQHGHRSQQQAARDNESWAYLLSLVSVIQERVGALSHDRATALAGAQAQVLLEELEQEMQNLRGISEDIAKLQWRLRRSLHERESSLSVLRSGAGNGTL